MLANKTRHVQSVLVEEKRHIVQWYHPNTPKRLPIIATRIHLGGLRPQYILLSYVRPHSPVYADYFAAKEPDTWITQIYLVLHLRFAFDYDFLNQTETMYANKTPSCLDLRCTIGSDYNEHDTIIASDEISMINRGYHGATCKLECAWRSPASRFEPLEHKWLWEFLHRRMSDSYCAWA